MNFFNSKQRSALKKGRTPGAVARRTREIYSQEGVYRASTIDHLPSTGEMIYSDVLLKIRLDLVRTFSSKAILLDVCCATGKHLNSFADTLKLGIGIDFSLHYLECANASCNFTVPRNTYFVCSDATKIPLRNDYFDVAYSFSTLYQIPNVDAAIQEMARVVKPGGKCIFDLGNLYSLNTFVANAYPELPDHCYIPVSRMKKIIYDSGLTILEHRAFQILPMWSDRPWWLKPLLSPRLTRLLEKKYKGKMLDEWLSNLLVFNSFAFRHLFVCEKG